MKFQKTVFAVPKHTIISFADAFSKSNHTATTLMKKPAERSCILEAYLRSS